MSDIKYMNIKEFRELGLLQEINRKFLHPMGLALEIKIEDGIETLGGIWDYRDDKEGIYFGEPKTMEDYEIRMKKAENVNQLFLSKSKARQELFHNIIQPILPPKGETIDAIQ